MFDVLGGDGDGTRSGGERARSAAVEAAVACLSAGVERADPARATREAVAVEDDALVVRGERYALDDVDRVVLVGAGKGADRVAAALVDTLDGRVDDGVVAVDEPAADLDLGPVGVRVGDHPVPSERGVAAARAVRERVAGADERTLVLAAVTGGASALLAAPVEDVPLDALRAVTRGLLDAGASVDEVNAVRKHASTVKGGRLAVAAAPARVVTVAVSDVVGDDPSVVGSGPTVPDASTYADALAVLDRYGVDAPAVRAHLEAGAAGGGWGGVAETPDADHEAFDDTGYHVVASARTAVAGAVEAAESRGFEATVLSTTMRGEASECGRFHAAVGREVAAAGDPVAPPAVIVSAGETTVAVSGDGDGGPNLEFVLGAALDLADGPPGADADVAVAAVDTDGRDGSTEDAGAVLSGDALADAELRDAARAALARNDACGFFDRFDRPAAAGADAADDDGDDADADDDGDDADADDDGDDADADDDGDAAASGRRSGGRLRSGATGTNVNDLRVVVVDDR